jgi:DNA-binding HxlR family transcriptional regulator
LTPFGKTLAPVLISLRQWGESYQAQRASDIAPIQEVSKPTTTRRRRTNTAGHVA